MDLQTELYGEAITRIASLTCCEVQQILEEAGPDALRLHYEGGLQLRGVLPIKLRNRLNRYSEHIASVARRVAPVERVVLDSPGFRSRSTPIGFDF